MEVNEQVNTMVAICMIVFLERHGTWMSLVKGAMSGESRGQHGGQGESRV